MRRPEPSRLRARVLLVALVAHIAGCTNGGSDYYPLEAGRWWQYETATTILEETARQKFVVSNLGEATVGGRDIAAQRVQAKHLRYYERRPDGIFRVGKRSPSSPKLTPDDPPLMVVPAASTGPDTEPFPIPSGLRLIESKTFARTDQLRPRRLPVALTGRVVERDAVVTVPAGRFVGCLVIEATGERFVPADRGNTTARVEVRQRDWFAPGVGLVRVERTERSDSPFLKAGRYLRELERYR